MSGLPMFGRQCSSIWRPAAIILLVLLVGWGIHRRRHHAEVSITPSIYSDCMGPNIVAHIRWDMQGTASGQTVFLSAYRVGQQPAVFGSGPLAGEFDTGEWVTDGTTLLLSDDKNHLLAKRTIESVDCATSPIWADSP